MPSPDAIAADLIPPALAALLDGLSDAHNAYEDTLRVYASSPVLSDPDTATVGAASARWVRAIRNLAAAWNAHRTAPAPAPFAWAVVVGGKADGDPYLDREPAEAMAETIRAVEKGEGGPVEVVPLYRAPAPAPVEASDGPAPTVHELKTWPGPFAAILAGTKRHEVRKADRNFHVGDVLHLREWQPNRERYTGREQRVTVTHLTAGGEWGLPHDVCVMSVAPAPPPSAPACVVCGKPSLVATSGDARLCTVRLPHCAEQDCWARVHRAIDALSTPPSAPGPRRTVHLRSTVDKVTGHLMVETVAAPGPLSDEELSDVFHKGAGRDEFDECKGLRAVASHATALLLAEIERLRGEAETYRRGCREMEMSEAGAMALVEGQDGTIERLTRERDEARADLGAALTALTEATEAERAGLVEIENAQREIAALTEAAEENADRIAAKLRRRDEAIAALTERLTAAERVVGTQDRLEAIADSWDWQNGNPDRGDVIDLLARVTASPAPERAAWEAETRRLLHAYASAVRATMHEAARDNVTMPTARAEDYALTAIERHLSLAPSPAGLTVKPRCRCTHEQGDSRCEAHPTCAECGEPTIARRESCAEHASEPRGTWRGDGEPSAAVAATFGPPSPSPRLGGG